MAKVNFNNIDADTASTTSRDFTVKFFSLKNGEEAIVRILIDSGDDFDIRTVHRVEMDGFPYGRNINCLNDSNNPESCPLCKRGDKLQQKLYIRMIKYSVENDGTVTPVPVVWERSRYDKAFGTQALITYMNTYGALSDIICRISRSGDGLNTIYTPTFGLNIMPNTKNFYTDERYVKDTTLFGDYDVLGVSILDKNFEELTQFVNTGAFPMRANNDATNTPTLSPTVNTSIPNVTVNTAPVEAVGVTGDVTPRATTWAPPSNGTGFARPRRY